MIIHTAKNKKIITFEFKDGSSSSIYETPSGNHVWKEDFKNHRKQACLPNMRGRWLTSTLRQGTSQRKKVSA